MGSNLGVNYRHRQPLIVKLFWTKGLFCRSGSYKNDFYDELVQLYQLKILSYQISSPKFGRFLSNDPFEHLRTDSKLIQNSIFSNPLVGETRSLSFGTSVRYNFDFNSALCFVSEPHKIFLKNAVCCVAAEVKKQNTCSQLSFSNKIVMLSCAVLCRGCDDISTVGCWRAWLGGTEWERERERERVSVVSDNPTCHC